MAYKLIANENRDVEVVMKAGTAYVRTVMPEGKAVGLIESAKSVEKSDKFDGLEIAINNGEMFFAGKLTADKPSKTEKTEEVKKPTKKPVTTAKKKKE